MKTKRLAYETHSSQQTRELGRKIGSLVQPGESLLLALCGDLGCGKTVLVQGLARGLAVPRDYYVTSPTYTLIHEYPGRCRLFHVDLYRIEDAAAIDDIGLDEIFQQDGVIAVEWADRLDERLPAEYIRVQMLFFNDASRRIELTAYGPEAADLLKKLASLS